MKITLPVITGLLLAVATLRAADADLKSTVSAAVKNCPTVQATNGKRPRAAKAPVRLAELLTPRGNLKKIHAKLSLPWSRSLV